MKQIVIVLFLALVIAPGCVSISDVKKWRKEDKFLLKSFGALCVADGLQTHSDWDSSRKELNPLVKNDTSMLAFGASSFYLTTLLADKYPKQRTGILFLANLVETFVVFRNHNHGVRIKFHK